VYLSNWAQPSGHEMPALSHTWSLAIEEQFYLVWPLVVFALPERALLRACLALAAGAFAVRSGLLALHQPPVAVYEYAIARIDALTLGAACAVIARRPEWLARVEPHLPRALAGCGALLLAMWPFTRGFNMFNPWVQVLGYGLLSVFFAALLLAAVLQPASLLARFLSAPWLRWVGRYSYAIYLYHGPIALMLAPHFEPVFDGPSPGAALAALVAFEASVIAASVLAAVASWNLLERWALSLKDRWAARAA
jgi:peptidoglycan/LPS O-acetylase OafA/YrhL